MQPTDIWKSDASDFIAIGDKIRPMKFIRSQNKRYAMELTEKLEMKVYGKKNANGDKYEIFSSKKTKNVDGYLKIN